MQNELRGAGTVFVGGWGGRLGFLLLGRHDDGVRRRGIVIVRLLVGHAERRVLLLGDAHVVAGVALLHDVPGAGVQQDGVLVELGQLGGPDAHQRHAVSEERKKKWSLDVSPLYLLLPQKQGHNK